MMVPTEGHMEINGSIAALLELASGFDPELTVSGKYLSSRRYAGLYTKVYE